MAIYELAGLRPQLAEGAFVAESAEVIGDVTIGRDSSIWFGCVVRGDVMAIRIGARTNIQDNSTIHVTGGIVETIVGDDVTVGHMALLHGCKIGDRTLVGMGSILLDGVEVGDDCFVAAGSLLTPNTKIPNGSFVIGRPARVKRPIGDFERAAIREATKTYGALSSQYASSDLKRIG